MKKIKFSELLKQDNVVIHTPKEKQAVKLLKKLDRLGYEWNSFKKLTSYNHYKIYEENTCYATSIRLNGKTYIEYCSLSFYRNEGCEIVEYKDIDFGNEDPLKKANTLRNVYIVSMMVLFISNGASLLLFALDDKIFFALTIALSLILIGIGVVAEQKAEDNYDKVHDEEIKNLKLGYEKELADEKKELAFEKKKLDAVLEYSLKLERKIEALRAYKAIYIDKSITSDGVPSKESLLKDIGDDIDLLTPPTLTEDKGVLIPISMPTLEESKIMSTFLSTHKAKLEEEIQQNSKIIDKALDLAFTIKTIYHNKEKGTTCVMFKDGKRVIVKRSKGEKDSVYTAVAYAITKMLYKSNTAFTKEVDKKIAK